MTKNLHRLLCSIFTMEHDFASCINMLAKLYIYIYNSFGWNVLYNLVKNSHCAPKTCYINIYSILKISFFLYTVLALNADSTD